MKIDRAIFRHVEAELYNYYRTKKQIKRLREQIMFSSVDVIKGGANSVMTASRPTEAIATRLVENRKLRNMEEIVSAIESVYEDLDDTQKKLVRLRYFERKPWNWSRIAMECHIHEQTAYKYRREIVKAIAEEVGWL